MQGPDARAAAGRWQRVGQPVDWVAFRAGGSFAGHVYSGCAYSYAGMPVQRDSVLLMDDGMRFRRVPR